MNISMVPRMGGADGHMGAQEHQPKRMRLAAGLVDYAECPVLAEIMNLSLLIFHSFCNAFALAHA